MALYTDMRSPSFHAHYNYVVHRLAADYPAECGIYGLPENAQTAVVDVAYYYQNLANLMRFGLLDKVKVLPMIRTRIINVWAALEPYVRTERQRQAVVGPITVLIALEQYAAEARTLTRVARRGPLDGYLSDPNAAGSARSHSGCDLVVRRCPSVTSRLIQLGQASSLISTQRRMT
jgi:hypothetical protein